MLIFIVSVSSGDRKGYDDCTITTAVLIQTLNHLYRPTHLFPVKLAHWDGGSDNQTRYYLLADGRGVR
jgi:hypothetical protein